MVASPVDEFETTCPNCRKDFDVLSTDSQAQCPHCQVTVQLTEPESAPAPYVPPAPRAPAPAAVLDDDGRSAPAARAAREVAKHTQRREALEAKARAAAERKLAKEAAQKRKAEDVRARAAAKAQSAQAKQVAKAAAARAAADQAAVKAATAPTDKPSGFARLNFLTRRERTAPDAREAVPVVRLEGVGPTFAAKLAKVGIQTSDDLLAADPDDLAKRTKIPRAEIRKWQDMADLVHVSGIGPQFAEVLVRCDINSVAELARQEPKPLVDRIQALIASKGVTIVGAGVSEKRANLWIAEARKLAPPPLSPAEKALKSVRGEDRAPQNPLLTETGLVEAIQFRGKAFRVECKRCEEAFLVADNVRRGKCPYCGVDQALQPVAPALRESIDPKVLAEDAKHEAQRGFLSRFSRREVANVPPAPKPASHAAARPSLFSFRRDPEASKAAAAHKAKVKAAADAERAVQRAADQKAKQAEAAQIAAGKAKLAETRKAEQARAAADKEAARKQAAAGKAQADAARKVDAERAKAAKALPPVLNPADAARTSRGVRGNPASQDSVAGPSAGGRFALFGTKALESVACAHCSHIFAVKASQRKATCPSCHSRLALVADGEDAPILPAKAAAAAPLVAAAKSRPVVVKETKATKPSATLAAPIVPKVGDEKALARLEADRAKLAAKQAKLQAKQDAKAAKLQAQQARTQAKADAKAAKLVAKADKKSTVSHAASPTSAQAVPIIALEGVGPTYARKLNAIGIETSNDLLARDADEVARKARISVVEVTKWQQMADLVLVNGIGPQFAEVLVRSGVDSVAELARRDPGRLAQRIQSLVDSKDVTIVGVDISAKRTAAWIKEARRMPAPKSVAASPALSQRTADDKASTVASDEKKAAKLAAKEAKLKAKADKKALKLQANQAKAKAKADAAAAKLAAKDKAHDAELAAKDKVAEAKPAGGLFGAFGKKAQPAEASKKLQSKADPKAQAKGSAEDKPDAMPAKADGSDDRKQAKLAAKEAKLKAKAEMRSAKLAAKQAKAKAKADAKASKLAVKGAQGDPTTDAGASKANAKDQSPRQIARLEAQKAKEADRQKRANAQREADKARLAGAVDSGLWAQAVARPLHEQRPDGVWVDSVEERRTKAADAGSKVERKDALQGKVRLVDGRSLFARLPEDKKDRSPPRLPDGNSPFTRLDEDEAKPGPDAPRLPDGRSAFERLPEDSAADYDRLHVFGHKPGKAYTTKGGFHITEEVLATQAATNIELGTASDRRTLRRQAKGDEKSRREQERQARKEAKEARKLRLQEERDAAAKRRDAKFGQDAPSADKPRLGFGRKIREAGSTSEPIVVKKAKAAPVEPAEIRQATEIVPAPSEAQKSRFGFLGRRKAVTQEPSKATGPTKVKAEPKPKVGETSADARKGNEGKDDVVTLSFADRRKKFLADRQAAKQAKEQAQANAKAQKQAQRDPKAKAVVEPEPTKGKSKAEPVKPAKGSKPLFGFLARSDGTSRDERKAAQLAIKQAKADEVAKAKAEAHAAKLAAKASKSAAATTPPTKGKTKMDKQEPIKKSKPLFGFLARPDGTSRDERKAAQLAVKQAKADEQAKAKAEADAARLAVKQAKEKPLKAHQPEGAEDEGKTSPVLAIFTRNKPAESKRAAKAKVTKGREGKGAAPASGGEPPGFLHLAARRKAFLAAQTVKLAQRTKEREEKARLRAIANKRKEQARAQVALAKQRAKADSEAAKAKEAAAKRKTQAKDAKDQAKADAAEARRKAAEKKAEAKARAAEQKLKAQEAEARAVAKAKEAEAREVAKKEAARRKEVERARLAADKQAAAAEKASRKQEPRGRKQTVTTQPVPLALFQAADGADEKRLARLRRAEDKARARQLRLLAKRQKAADKQALRGEAPAIGTGFKRPDAGSSPAVALPGAQPAAKPVVRKVAVQKVISRTVRQPVAYDRAAIDAALRSHGRTPPGAI